MSSRLAYPEVRAALAAAGRSHDLDTRGLSAALRTWDLHVGVIAEQLAAAPATLPP